MGSHKHTNAPERTSNQKILLTGVRSKLLFHSLAETFQALGDPSRLKVIWALSTRELCVGDIAKLTSLSQPAASHHLRTLRQLKLVKVRRTGRTAFYALDDIHINRLLKEGIRHVEEFLP